MPESLISLAADALSPGLAVLSLVSYLVLLFYIVRTAWLFAGKKAVGDDHAMRESMAAMYTAFAAYLIAMSVSAMLPFVENVGQAAGMVSGSRGMGVSVRLIAALVFTAFVANCSRSLFMLKSLDHGIFPPIPEWEKLVTFPAKRLSEFVVRACAAALFIGLEYQLKVLASGAATLDTIGQNGAISPFTGATTLEGLLHAGQFGTALYTALLVWWVIGRWIAASQMTWEFLWFYLSGLTCAAFVWAFAGSTPTESTGILLFVALGFVTLAAGFMLWVVAKDLWVAARNVHGVVTTPRPTPATTQP